MTHKAPHDLTLLWVLLEPHLTFSELWITLTSLHSVSRNIIQAALLPGKQSPHSLSSPHFSSRKFQTVLEISVESLAAWGTYGTPDSARSPVIWTRALITLMHRAQHSHHEIATIVTMVSVLTGI